MHFNYNVLVGTTLIYGSITGVHGHSNGLLCHLGGDMRRRASENAPRRDASKGRHLGKSSTGISSEGEAAGMLSDFEGRFKDAPVVHCRACQRTYSSGKPLTA